jgi:hypothetical protein
MKRSTLGITTALVSAVALVSAGTLVANAAPQPVVNPLLAQQDVLRSAAEQAETISSALGLSGGERLIPRDVVRDAAYDSPTCDNQRVGREKAEKIRYRALTTTFTSSTTYAAARTGTLAAAADRAWAAVNVE